MWILLALLMLITGGLSKSASRFTNIDCQMLDPSYASFKQCNLKVVGRGIIALNIYVKQHKPPITNAKLNVSLWSKFNGYRPFMFNITFDFCKFMLTSTRTNLSFQKILFDAMVANSNVNHTCPYDHDVFIHNLVFKDYLLRYLPLPAGEYKVQTMMSTNNEWKSNVNVHFVIREDLINV